MANITVEFSPSDFMAGVSLMTDEEVGQYIKLLCYQAEKGPFDATAMLRLCRGNASPEILQKFKLENGLYFNERMEIERNKSLQRSESQRLKAKMRWQSHGIAPAMPARSIILKSNNSLVGKKRNTTQKLNVKGDENFFEKIPEAWPKDDFLTHWAEFVEMRKLKKKPLTANAAQRRLQQLVSISEGSYQLALKILLRSTDNAWDEFYPIVSESKSNGIKSTTHDAGRKFNRDKA